MNILFLPHPKTPTLVGQSFGRLVVHSYLGRTWHRDADSIYRCVCSCGNETLVRGSSLRKGSTKSCGCLHQETARAQGLSNRSSNPNQRAWREVYSGYKYSARTRALEFNLTLEEAKAIMTQDCHYCGISPTKCYWKKGKEQIRLKYKDYYDKMTIYRNGIDRIDNTKGYTLDNCISACKNCNIAKATLTYDDFINLAINIAKRHG